MFFYYLMFNKRNTYKNVMSIGLLVILKGVCFCYLAAFRYIFLEG